MAGCGKCGAENKDGAKFCKACGTSMSAPEINSNNCTACSAPLLPGAKFCKKCGNAVVSITSDTAPLAPPTPAVTTPPIAEPPTPIIREAIIAQSVDKELVPEPSAVNDGSQQYTPPPATAETIAMPKVTAAADVPPAAPPRTTDVNQTKSEGVPSPRSNTSKNALLAASVVLTVTIASAGYFLWSNQKSSIPAVSEPNAAAKANVADTAVPPSPTVPSEVTQAAPPVVAPVPTPPTAAASVSTEAPVPAPAPVLTPPVHSAQAREDAPVASPIPVKRAAPEITQHVNVASPPPPPIPAPDPMANKVATLLSKADGYIANRQYDKAIATAETVLELDPSSTAARAMVNKAKSKQMDALKSGSSLE